MNHNTPLILLHGALGSKDQFAALEETLQDSFKIFTLNFEGHGGRSSSREYTIANFKENVLQLMEEQKLTSACIFGYSMGGYVALKLAIDHPEKVEKVMTLGTKFAWTPDIASQEVSRLNPLKIEAKVPQFAKQLEQIHSPLDWHQVLSKTAAMMIDLGDGKGIATKDFKKVECQVLIAAGSEDQLVTIAESREVANTVPRGSFHLFEGFKHPLEQVDVEELVTAVKEFMR